MFPILTQNLDLQVAWHCNSVNTQRKPSTCWPCFVIGATWVLLAFLLVSPAFCGSITFIIKKQFLKQQMHQRHCQEKLKKAAGWISFECPGPKICWSPSEIREHVKENDSVSEEGGVNYVRNYESSAQAWAGEAPLGSLACLQSTQGALDPSLSAAPLPYSYALLYSFQNSLPSASPNGVIVLPAGWQLLNSQGNINDIRYGDWLWCHFGPSWSFEI